MHRLKGSREEWLTAYDKELYAMLFKKKRLVEVFGEERGHVIKYKRVTRMRMNPEHKKPNPEHPDVRKKFRLLIRGDTEPKEWTTMATDSPVAAPDTLLMLVFSGEQSDTAETLSTCDADAAFLQSMECEPKRPS